MSPEVPRDRHPAHRSDLQVDDRNIDRLLGRSVGGGARVFVVKQLVASETQRSVDLVSVAYVVGDDQDPGHVLRLAVSSEMNRGRGWGRMSYYVLRIT